MAEKSARYYGNHVSVSRFGDSLIARDGNGDSFGEMSTKGYESHVVTPEMVSMLITHAASKDIALGNITFPPDPETAVSLGQSFYETFLYDTTTNRVEVVERYVAELIDQLQAVEESPYTPVEAELVEYVEEVHAALYATAA